MKKRWIVVLALLIVILRLHISPTLSLRIYLVLSGYPIIAFETDLKKIESENEIGENAQLYELTNPPFEASTQSELETFIVKRYGIFYISKFYVDI